MEESGLRRDPCGEVGVVVIGLVGMGAWRRTSTISPRPSPHPPAKRQGVPGEVKQANYLRTGDREEAFETLPDKRSCRHGRVGGWKLRRVRGHGAPVGVRGQPKLGVTDSWVPRVTVLPV